MAQMTEKQYREELSKILFGLAGNFGDTFDAYTLDLWRKMFKADGFTLEQIKEAAVKIMRTRKISKMPTYAEFVESIQGSPEDSAQAQADIVLETLQLNGSRIRPEFSDPVTAHLMSTRWKWERWAPNVTEDEIKWWRKEFIEAYQSYAGNPESIEHVKRLTAPEKMRRLVSGIGSGEESKEREPELIEE